MSGTPLDLIVFPAIGAGAAVVNAGYTMIRGEANARSAATQPSENPYLKETKTVQTQRHNYGTSMYRELPGGGFMAASQGDNSGGCIITTTTTHTAVYGFPKQKSSGKWWR